MTCLYRQRLINYLDGIDKEAETIGAVNVVENRDGYLHGRNSDWIGAIEALRSVTSIEGKRVALLGAGGAAVNRSGAALEKEPRL